MTSGINDGRTGIRDRTTDGSSGEGAGTSGPPSRSRPRVARAVVALAAGMSAAAWAVHELLTPLYVAGCALTAIGVGLLVGSVLRRRGHDRGVRLIAACTAAGLLLTTVGVPWLSARTTGRQVSWSVDLGTGTGTGTEMILAVDDTIVLVTGGDALVLDLETGATRARIETGDDGIAEAVPAGGGQLVVTSSDSISLWSLEGQLRWQVDRWAQDGQGWRAVAARDGVVVLAVDGEEPRVVAREPSGAVVWQESGLGYGRIEVATPAVSPGSSTSTLPSVAFVRQPDEALPVALDVLTGAQVDISAPGRPEAVMSDTVLFAEPPADPDEPNTECAMAAVTAGRALWTATLPCMEQWGVSTVQDGQAVYRSTMTAEAAGADATTAGGGTVPERAVISLDLSSGEAVPLPADRVDDEWNRSVAGELFVLHQQDRPTAVLARPHAGAEPIWTFAPQPPAGIPRIEVGDGTVALLSGPLGYNPMISQRTRINADQVTVLDGRTGATLGTLRPGNVWDMTIVAPGRVLVVSNEREGQDDSFFRATLVGSGLDAE